MSGYAARLRETMQDIEAARVVQRQHNDETIRSQLEFEQRQASTIAKLRATGVMRSDDPLFFGGGGQTSVTATEGGSAMTRAAAFGHLRAGGSRESVPEQFLRDFDASKHLWGE